VFLAKNGFLGMACTLKALGRGRIITQGLEHNTNIILWKALHVT
jgi:selenocysteine lyase/cysteine desulfurase